MNKIHDRFDNLVKELKKAGFRVQVDTINGRARRCYQGIPIRKATVFGGYIGGVFYDEHKRRFWNCSPGKIMITKRDTYINGQRWNDWQWSSVINNRLPKTSNESKCLINYINTNLRKKNVDLEEISMFYYPRHVNIDFDKIKII